MSTAKELLHMARAQHPGMSMMYAIEAIKALVAEAEERDRAVGERLARLEERAGQLTRAYDRLEEARVSDAARLRRAEATAGWPTMPESVGRAIGLTPTPSACRWQTCVGTCIIGTSLHGSTPHKHNGACVQWCCDGTGPAHRPAAAATAEPERTDTPSVPPSGSVAPAVPTTGRLVAVGTCYSHPTWGDHEHEAGCINWCWSVRYGMSAAPPAPVFALTEWEREHVRIGLAAGKGSLVGTLARIAVRALAALGVPLDGEGSR